MKTIVLLLLIIPITAIGINTSSSSMIITRETIKQAGLTQISDIFLLIENWDISTIDGMTWQANPIDQPSFQHQQWIVIVDDKEMDIGLFGTKCLDRIPVNLSQIEKIEITSGPVIHNGKIFNSGLIEIQTVSPKPGFTIKGQAAIGNEIGDPGPYRYTEYTSPNIDKTGHEVSTNFSYRKGYMYLQADLRRTIHYPTDLAMRYRNINISEIYPRQKLWAGAVKLVRKTGGHYNEIFLGQSRFNDFFFLKAYGREIPVESRFSYYGFKGAYLENKRFRLDYYLAYSENSLNKFRNSLNLDFDWKLINQTTGIDFLFPSNSIDYRAGLDLKRYIVRTEYNLSDDEITIGNFSNGIRYNISSSIIQSIGLAVTFYEREIGYKGIINNQWKYGASKSLDLMISYEKKLFEETNSLWLWSERGYNFLEDNGVDYSIEEEITASKKLGVDLIWSQVINRRLFISLTGFYRSFADLYLEKQTFQFSQADYSFSSPVIIYTEQNGRLAGSRLSCELKLTPQLKQRFTFNYQSVIDGDDLFKDILKATPAYSLHSSISFTPEESFSLQAALRYKSSSVWIDYNECESQSDGKYSQNIDDFLTLDLSVQKYFLQRKIRANFTIRNLFSSEMRYHPIGAEFDLSYFTVVECSIY